jgi:hypothetical protein
VLHDRVRERVTLVVVPRETRTGTGRARGSRWRGTPGRAFADYIASFILDCGCDGYYSSMALLR